MVLHPCRGGGAGFFDPESSIALSQEKQGLGFGVEGLGFRG